MHIQKKWNSGVLFSLLFTLLLTACSSGGGDSAAPVVPAGTAEGLWTGTTGDGRTVKGAVLDDGTYWFLYSADSNPALMAGALQGNGSTQNGTFPLLNALYFSNDNGAEGIYTVPVTASVTASYVMRQDLNVTVTLSRGSLTLTSTFDPEYDQPPVIANVEGTYPGSAFGFPHTITILPDGTITVTTTGGPHLTGAANDTGIELGCDFIGILSPSLRSHGNVYDIFLEPYATNNATYGWCSSETLTGVAFFDAATTNKKIYVLALNPSRTRVFPFMGTRP